jgi:hypothetical protein
MLVKKKIISDWGFHSIAKIHIVIFWIITLFNQTD